MKYKHEYLSIKEFAELVGSSRATLVHYDELGLLKPAIVKENGYRYYLPEQAQAYLVVLLFAECGIPLRTIKEYTSSFDEKNGRKLVNVALRNAEEQIHKLNQIRNYMRVKRDYYELALGQEDRRPFITRLPETTYIISSVRSVPDSIQIQTDHAIAISRYLSEHGEFPDHPYIAKIDIEYDDDGSFVWKSFKESDSEIQLAKREEGLYGCYIETGDEIQVGTCISELFQFAREIGFEPVGSVFMTDTANFVITQNHDEYRTMFSVRLRLQDEKGFL